MWLKLHSPYDEILLRRGVAKRLATYENPIYATGRLEAALKPMHDAVRRRADWLCLWYPPGSQKPKRAAHAEVQSFHQFNIAPRMLEY